MYRFINAQLYHFCIITILAKKAVNVSLELL